MAIESSAWESSSWFFRGGGSAAALTVGQFTRHLTALVREDVILQDIWLRGEVSNLTRAASGHVYFSIKDEEACLSCVLWRSAAARLRFRLEPGMQLLLHGWVDVYAARGQYQLVVDEAQPDGAGALHLALEQARRVLLAEGLLDAERKRPLPVFPERVAVITSRSGAAVQDICVTLQRAPHPPEIILIPTAVQGEEAVAGLCAALRLANLASGADVIVLGRGGGALEDLWCFNTEPVARAIAGSRTPVISAVGHETDFTLADMAADLRAATPTAAAELIVAQRADVLQRLGAALEDVQALCVARVATERLRLDALRARAPLSRPEWLVESRRQRLDDLNGRLLRAREVCLTRLRHRLALAAGKLDSLSPLATLARGYATVSRLPEESPVLEASEVRPGDRVRVRLADGAFDSDVVRVDGSGTEGGG